MHKQLLAVTVILITGIILCRSCAGYSSSDSADGGQQFGISIGNLLFMDMRPIWKHLFDVPFNPGYSNDHVILSLGGHLYIEAGNYTIFQKISYLDGVQIHSKLWLNIFFCNFSCATIHNATNLERREAVRFALSQLGCAYQNPYKNHTVYDSWHANFDPDDPIDPYATWWYCSELCWASYYQQGINIDATPEKVLDDDGKYYYKTICDDIKKSGNVTLYPYT
ncbi:MAG: hypothetical protein KKG04_01835, partial [Candidatus Thermoplasmatota archaeon]|nr:hypothetical protein [Candidatus Thermoplasmatota archaeon]